MRRTAVLAIMAITACQKPVAPLSVREQRQAALDQIADRCGLARSTFKLISDDQLQLQPSPDAQYQSVDCALTELKKANLPLKLGFIGNEYYVGNEQ